MAPRSEWHAEDSSVWLVIVGPVLSEECAADLKVAIRGGMETCCQTSRQDELGRGLAVDGVAYHPAVERDVLLAAMIESCALLNSSTSEGMCNSLLEGMACGTPVVARAVPGNLEVIEIDPLEPDKPTDPENHCVLLAAGQSSQITLSGIRKSDSFDREAKPPVKTALPTIHHRS
jgi:glycosyltransferase involved in cell wall biosynthesis